VIGPRALILAAAIATADGAAPEGPSIRWEVAPPGTIPTVIVAGLAPRTIEALRRGEGPADRRSGLLSVTIGAGRPGLADRPSMVGAYRIEGDSLRFTPRYPLDPGRAYVATFRPANLPGAAAGGAPELTALYLVPKPARASTVVTRVDPSGDRLPENLLKFYLHFSAPMGRGEAYDRVRLVGDDGRAVDRPFLRLGEELWDPTGTRLTLLIDPGRIKRGLRPREEFGPVLEAGRSYTLVVDPDWRDTEGDPLGSGHRKAFRAGPADDAQPDPKTWSIARPAASTREPIALTFPEPLDRALLESALTVADARGDAVPGRIEVDAGQARWRFTPDSPWAPGDYRIVIEDDLEDLAGNSIRRPFEVDIQRDTPARPEARTVRLPIPIRDR